MKWEQRVHKVDAKFNELYKFKIGKLQIENRVCDYGAFIFALIALGSYVLYTVDVNNCMIAICGIFFICGIIMALIATVVTFRLCRKASDFEKLTQIFEKAFEELKD